MPQRRYDIESAIHTRGVNKYLVKDFTCKTKMLLLISARVGDFMFKFVEKRWNPNAILLIHSTSDHDRTDGREIQIQKPSTSYTKFLYIFL